MNGTIKRCPNCGAEFKSLDQREIYCSSKCFEESKNQRKVAYNRLYRNGYDDYLGPEIFMLESDRTKKPTINEIVEVKATLNDFGYDSSLSIPEFDTYAKLNAWKIDMIDAILS